MTLDHTIILDKFLGKSHGNGFYPSQKLFLVMDSIGLKIIGSQNEKYTVIKFIKKKNKEIFTSFWYLFHCVIVWTLKIVY